MYFPSEFAVRQKFGPDHIASGYKTVFNYKGLLPFFPFPFPFLHNTHRRFFPCFPLIAVLPLFLVAFLPHVSPFLISPFCSLYPVGRPLVFLGLVIQSECFSVPVQNPLTVRGYPLLGTCIPEFYWRQG